MRATHSTESGPHCQESHNLSTALTDSLQSTLVHIYNMHIFVLSFGINLRIELNSQIFGNIFIIKESVAQIEFPNTKFVYLKK